MTRLKLAFIAVVTLLVGMGNLHSAQAVKKLAASDSVSATVKEAGLLNRTIVRRPLYPRDI